MNQCVCGPGGSLTEGRSSVVLLSGGCLEHCIEKSQAKYILMGKDGGCISFLLLL